MSRKSLEITEEFERWCDEQDENCPVICLEVLELLETHKDKEPCKNCQEGSCDFCKYQEF